MTQGPLPRVFALGWILATAGCGSFLTLFGGNDAGAMDAGNGPDVVDSWTATRDVAEDTIGNVDMRYGQMSSSVTMGNDGHTLAAGAIDAAAMQFELGATAIDLNGDGVTEWLVTRDAHGVAVVETIDSDGDGRPDLVWDRTGVTHFFLADRNHDGRYEYRRETTPSSIAPGAIAYLVTEDSDGDFESDQRISYLDNPQEDTIVYLWEYWDTERNDWSRDVVGTSSGPREQDRTATTPSSGPGMCTPMQLAMIQMQLDQATMQGISCLSGADPTVAAQAEHDMSTPIEIECEPIAGGHTCAEAENVAEHQHDSTGTRRVIVTPMAADGTGSCGSLAGTLFHEMMHFVDGSHQFGHNGRDGIGDLGDRVYGCEQFCFDSQHHDQFSCAQCLGTQIHDSRCDPFPPVQCDAILTQRACSCSGALYSGGTSPADCFNGCTAPGCFDPRCSRRGPCP